MLGHSSDANDRVAPDALSDVLQGSPSRTRPVAAVSSPRLGLETGTNGARLERDDKPPLGEALEDAAQVAAVDIQRPREIDSRRCRGAGHPRVAVIPDLVEHTHFGQRERRQDYDY
jgi:hypothetical protein